MTPVHIGDGTCIHETDKAILVELEGGKAGGEIWIPKSQLHDDSEVYKEHDAGKIIVSKWFAKEKGLT